MCSGIFIEMLCKFGGKSNSFVECFGIKGLKFKGVGVVCFWGYCFGEYLYMFVGNFLKSCEGKMEDLWVSLVGGLVL